VEEKWREGGVDPDSAMEKRGGKKGRARLRGAWRKGGVRPRRRARGEGGNGPGAAVPGRQRAHDAPGRERERRDDGRWATGGAGPSDREREKARG
jgi:hypothetical protein